MVRAIPPVTARFRSSHVLGVIVAAPPGRAGATNSAASRVLCAQHNRGNPGNLSMTGAITEAMSALLRIRTSTGIGDVA